MIKLNRTKIFTKLANKLNKNELISLDLAVREIAKNPLIGELKKGDLGDIRVYKFRMVNQLTLVAYRFDHLGQIVLLLFFGTHENFYRDLKNKL